MAIPIINPLSWLMIIVYIVYLTRNFVTYSMFVCNLLQLQLSYIILSHIETVYSALFITICLTSLLCTHPGHNACCLLVCVYRSKLSHPEHRKLLKDFCLAFNNEVDKSQSNATMEEAAMYVFTTLITPCCFHCIPSLSAVCNGTTRPYFCTSTFVHFYMPVHLQCHR